MRFSLSTVDQPVVPEDVASQRHAEDLRGLLTVVGGRVVHEAAPAAGGWR